MPKTLPLLIGLTVVIAMLMATLVGDCARESDGAAASADLAQAPDSSFEQRLEVRLTEPLALPADEEASSSRADVSPREVVEPTRSVHRFTFTGIVIDETRAPVENARVELRRDIVETRVSIENARAELRRDIVGWEEAEIFFSVYPVSQEPVLTDEHGRFHLDLKSDSSATAFYCFKHGLYLDIRHPRYLGRGTSGSRQGSGDWVYSLHSAGEIRGRVLVDEGVPLARLTAELHTGSKGPLWSQVDQDGGFTFSALRPDQYDLRLRLAPHDEVVASRPEFPVTPKPTAEAADPCEFDVRGKIHRLAIDCRDDAGNALAQFEAMWTPLGLPQGKRHREKIDTGRLEVFTTAEAVKLSVHAPGLATSSIARVSEDRTVVLGSPIAVVLHLPDLRCLPPGDDRLLARLYPSREAFDGRPLAIEFDRAGKGRALAPEPGPHTVHLFVVRQEENTVRRERVQGLHESIIVTGETTPDTFEVHPSPAEVRAALARLDAHQEPRP